MKPWRRRVAVHSCAIEARLETIVDACLSPGMFLWPQRMFVFVAHV